MDILKPKTYLAWRLNVNVGQIGDVIITYNLWIDPTLTENTIGLHSFNIIYEIDDLRREIVVIKNRLDQIANANH